jgi:TatD DNase family protein
MIDSHTHLNDPRLLPEVEAVVARMVEAGVKSALVVGYDVASSEQAVQLARQYPGVLCAAVGMHPHESKHLDDAALAALAKLATEPEVVAYGEIGLDFHYEYSPRDAQREAFRRQLGLAAELGLPIIIHERAAAEEVMAILDAEEGGRLGGVWHCCSVAPDMGKEIARRLFIGIAGWITFPKAENIRELARAVPLDRLLTETDCPYLAPVPHRGKRNEPAHVRLVAEALAKVKELALERIEQVTTENTLRAFARWEGQYVKNVSRTWQVGTK